MKHLVRTGIMFLSLAIFFLTISLATGQDQQQSCSTASDVATFSVITNGTNHPLKYYWIDDKCKEIEYGTIDPGQTLVQPTFTTHPWMVRMAEGGVQVGETMVSDLGTPVIMEAACSLTDEVETNLTVVNNSSVSAKFYWVNYDCAEIEYGVLAPGEAVTQPTYDSHVWVMRNADTGALLSRTRAEALIAPASQ